MQFEKLSPIMQRLIYAAADAGCTNGTMASIHADPQYKALTAQEQAEVNRTYYDAIKYCKQWVEDEIKANSTINNIDCLV